MRTKINLLSLVVVVVLVLSLLTSCTSNGGGTTTSSTTTTSTGGIKYGGRLNVAFLTNECMETLQCDEKWQYNAMACLFWPLVYDQLWIMGPGPDFKPEPMLATSWETEDGGQTWTFHLRHDAVFHDGVPVTAEDVAFTIEYLPLASPAWAFPDIMAEEGSIQVIDQYTVKFKLLASIGTRWPAVYWAPILPKHIWEPYKDDMASFDNAAAIGSGPFKLKEFKSAEYVWLEANKDYCGGRPYLDEVVFRGYGSEDARMMALQTGEADMLGYRGCSPSNVADFEKMANVEVLVAPSTLVGFLAFNLHKETALQDLNVRKAIMYGLDQDRIIQMVSLGYAEKIDSFIYPEMEEHNPNLPQYNYDPALANQILDDAGYVDSNGDGIREGLSFQLVVPSNTTDAVKSATLMKEQLAEIGVGITIVALDPSTLDGFFYAPTDDKYEIAFESEEPGPHSDWMWMFCLSWGAGGEGWNGSYWSNSQFDADMAAMTSATNMEEREQYLFEMQLLMAQELPYGMLSRPQIINPVRTDKFEGWVNTLGGIDNWINPWTFLELHLK
jgi:peptide/nickel transport system substrate-binding protein